MWFFAPALAFVRYEGSPDPAPDVTLAPFLPALDSELRELVKDTAPKCMAMPARRSFGCRPEERLAEGQCPAAADRSFPYGGSNPDGSPPLARATIGNLGLLPPADSPKGSQQDSPKDAPKDSQGPVGPAGLVELGFWSRAAAGLVAACEWDAFEKTFKPAPRDDKTAHFANGDLGHRAARSNVLWLYPTADYNDAFQVSKTTVCNRLTGWHGVANTVHVHRVSTVKEALGVLAQYANDSLLAVILGGHGNGSELQWGSSWSGCGRGSLCMDKPPEKWTDDWWALTLFRTNLNQPSLAFVALLGHKMHAHGLVMVDSCKGGTDGGIAQYLSAQLGRGIRVIGFTKPFSRVYSSRFGTGYYVNRAVVHENGLASIAVTPQDNSGVVREYRTGGVCPPWAKSPDPTRDGDCECPAGSRCSRGEHACFRSFGRTSDALFDPACALFGAPPCRCEAVVENTVPDLFDPYVAPEDAPRLEAPGLASPTVRRAPPPPQPMA